MVMCNRCGKETRATIMSMFNVESICTECKSEESMHPRYGEALKADMAAIKAGNYNFPGIGLPPDLAERAKARDAARIKARDEEERLRAQQGKE